MEDFTVFFLINTVSFNSNWMTCVKPYFEIFDCFFASWLKLQNVIELFYWYYGMKQEKKNINIEFQYKYDYNIILFLNIFYNLEKKRIFGQILIVFAEHIFTIWINKKVISVRLVISYYIELLYIFFNLKLSFCLIVFSCNLDNTFSHIF